MFDRKGKPMETQAITESPLNIMLKLSNDFDNEDDHNDDWVIGERISFTNYKPLRPMPQAIDHASCHIIISITECACVTLIVRKLTSLNNIIIPIREYLKTTWFYTAKNGFRERNGDLVLTKCNLHLIFVTTDQKSNLEFIMYLK